jgi:enterochelin esterase family protein
MQLSRFEICGPVPLSGLRDKMLPCSTRSQAAEHTRPSTIKSRHRKSATAMQVDRRALWLACATMNALACSNASSLASSSTTVSSGNGRSSASSGIAVSAGNSGAPASGGTAGSTTGVGGGGESSGVGAAESGRGLDASAEASAATVPEGGASALDGSAESAPPGFCTPGDAGDGKYTLTGDAAPPEWQLMPGVTAGKLTPSASFLSTTFGLHFPYIIYTSANYVSGRPAVFLVVGDGISTYLNGGFHAATVLDNLTASGDMPPTVALFVDPPSDGGDPATVRVDTYDPPTDKYPTFLMTELIPQVITGKYSISSDPDAWAIVGYSASGGAGWNVVWKQPDNFHKFIGASESIGAANVAMYGNVNWVEIVSTSPEHDVRVSSSSCLNDLVDQRGSWLTIITNFSMALAAKGYPWRLVIGPNSHYPPVDGERDFPDALRWTFQGCKFPTN